MIQTPRLLLRTIDESKTQNVLDYILRNAEFLQEWEAARAPDFYTFEAQRQLLAADRMNMEKGRLFKVWIYKADFPDRMIGSVSLSNIVRGVFQSCNLGYRLDRDELVKGYMTEAISGVIRHAFHELKLHRIEANIMPRNKASLRVVEKLGFESEGLARKYLKINGQWVDHIHMVLLNEEME